MTTYDPELARQLCATPNKGDLATALADQLEAAGAEIARLNAQPVRLFDHLAAERMADEIAGLVQRKVIGSRCPAADALLDYRDPPRSERSDRLVDLENQIERVTKQLDRAMAESSTWKAGSDRMISLRSTIPSCACRVCQGVDAYRAARKAGG